MKRRGGLLLRRAAALVAALGLLVAPANVAPGAGAAPSEEGKNICLMQYLVADSDLEYAITADLLELMDSDFIRRPNVQTWVFYDAHGNMYDYDQDGWNEAPLSDANGPIFLWFDHRVKELGVLGIFEESDSDSPEVLCYFLRTALMDCVANGAEEFVLTFSSHGGGHVGLGGDVNPWRRRRRLYQSNEDVVEGVRCALDNVEGAPSRFDLIGFDACLMSSFLAFREYAPLATRLLASEANVPGHGWYWNLTASAAESALSMGMELQSSFLSETQNSLNPEEHLTPKTLALIDAVGYDIFSVAFERFAKELTNLLEADNDQNFFASIQRTRNGIMAFEAADDPPGTPDPSAVDIGSFLAVFQEKCVPVTSSTIADALENAIGAYNAQFVAQGVGPGTKPATGMSIYFPSKKGWKRDDIDKVDYGDTSNAWLQFLLLYLTSSTPTKAKGDSICRTTFKSDIEPTFPGQLLLNPDLVNEDSILVSSDITVNTDIVDTRYGFADTRIEVTTRRRMMEAARVYIDSNQNPRHYTSQRRQQRVRSHRAYDQTSEHEESLIMFSGDLVPNYDGPTYSCTWNKVVYLAYDESNGSKIDAHATALYVTALGDGTRYIPALYYPPYQEITSYWLPFASPVADALALGAYLATVHFTVDEITGEIVSPISLYKSALPGGQRGSMYEVARSEGGCIVPIVYAEASYGDGAISLELSGDIHKWDNNFGILPVDTATYFGMTSLDSLVIIMHAWDLDLDKTQLGGFDMKRFDVALNEATGELEETEWDGTLDSGGLISEDNSSIGDTTSDTEFVEDLDSIGTVIAPSSLIPTYEPTIDDAVFSNATPAPARKKNNYNLILEVGDLMQPSVNFATDTPTKEPSKAPPLSPSNFATDVLSNIQSSSQFPTHVPTKEPFEAPSLSPSNFPTDVLSNIPSQFPTHVAAKEPSKAPPLIPSIFPTDVLSNIPSSSQFLTYVPTKEPSKTPPLRPFPTNAVSDIPSSSKSLTDGPTKESLQESSKAPPLSQSHLLLNILSNVPSSSKSPTDLPPKEPFESPPLSSIHSSTSIPTDASSSRHPPKVPSKEPTKDATRAPTSTTYSSSALQLGASFSRPVESPEDALTNENNRVIDAPAKGSTNEIEALLKSPAEVTSKEHSDGILHLSNVPTEEPNDEINAPTSITNNVVATNSKEANSSGRCTVPILMGLAILLVHLMR